MIDAISKLVESGAISEDTQKAIQDAWESKIKENKEKYGDKLNIYQCVVYDENDKEVDFNITSNGQSSSILQFGSHSSSHPEVKVVNQEKLKTRL